VTAIHPHAAITPLPEVPLEGVALSWEVLADAPAVVQASGGTPVERALLHITFTEGRAAAVLEWRPEGGGRPVRVLLAESERPVRCTTDTSPGGGLVHLDVPGLLRASVLPDARGGARVWYARTPILTPPGFPAGSYDRPSASWGA
jgi:hypothetical protein